MHHFTEKISFEEAIAMLDTGHYIMHLSWLLGGESSEIYRQNSDCSHFLVKAGQDWRNPNNPIVLVIADAEAEKKYMSSRAGAEKYGDRDRTYEELVIENQLIKKAVIEFLHDSASPVSCIRHDSSFIKRSIDRGEYDKANHFNKRIISRGVDVLNKFYHTLWRAVDRRNPPDNEELRTIIEDIGKILDEQRV